MATEKKGLYFISHINKRENKFQLPADRTALKPVYRQAAIYLLFIWSIKMHHTKLVRTNYGPHRRN